MIMGKKTLRYFHLLTLVAVLSISSGACKLLGLEEEADNRLREAIALALLSANNSSSAVCTNSSLSGAITANTNGCGTLTGVVTVESGATLTINAGTTIQMQPGSALIVKPGGQINAVGTANSPIVFTSSKTAGSRAAGDWGGISLVGSAANTDPDSQNIEASSSVSYGGSSSNNSSDSSGTMQYVRIEFAGETINSVAQNCLSLYTVGSGTTIDHVQCHMGADDGFVWFGGNVNAKNLLATGIADDSFEITEGYGGSLQYIIAHQYTAAQVTHSSTPYGMDVYGSPTGNTSTGNASLSNPTIQNISLHGSTITNAYGIFASAGMTGSFQTGFMFGYPASNVRCNDNAGTGANTNPDFDLRGDASYANTSGGECVQISVPGNLSAQPYTSAGDVANNTAPDYTSTAGTTGCGATSTSTFLVMDSTCGGMTSTSGNWASGWTYYQPN